MKEYKEFARAKQLGNRFAVSESTIWRWVRRGILPKPFKPTQRTSLFDVKECQIAIDKMAGET
ncbi:MAG: AlpA family transcriptional regulator [Flavobacteriaceae bacterium]|nr:MAG: AlpA family transcriptional regulator [Flavobacteriaceae bacterium]